VSASFQVIFVVLQQAAVEVLKEMQQDRLQRFFDYSTPLSHPASGSPALNI